MGGILGPPEIRGSLASMMSSRIVSADRETSVRDTGVRKTGVRETDVK